MVRTLAPWTPRLPRPLARLEREMEGLMERFFGPGEEIWTGTEMFAPKVNLAETEEKFEVTVELPGLKPEEFKVEMKNGELWISGEKKEEHEEKGKAWHRIERRYGEFQRVIPLPSTVTEEKVEAEYKEGVLKVIVPKTEKAKPRPIEVKA